LLHGASQAGGPHDVQRDVHDRVDGQDAARREGDQAEDALAHRVKVDRETGKVNSGRRV